jgi:hypothetical protein
MPKLGTPQRLGETPGPGWVRADLHVRTVDGLARMNPIKCLEQAPVLADEVTAAEGTW